VKPGRILIEISGLPEETAKEAMRLASHKLPIKTKMVAAYDLATADEGA
jgi:large subunit ribosomal protein L16